MNDRSWPSESPDVARVEALRRLAVREPGAPQPFDDLLTMLADLLHADLVSLIMVEHERAWSLASSASSASSASATSVAETATTEVPRTWALADAVVRGDEDLVVRATASDEAFTDHPLFAGMSQPGTVAAQAIRAPGGDVVGALEVAWSAELQLDAEARRTLARSAGLVAALLELQAEASEYSRFVELSPDPIAILDLEGGIQQVNSSFVSMLGGHSPDALVGRGFLELVDRTDRARVTAELARVLLMHRRRGRLKLRLVADDGRVIPCAVSAGHLRGVRRHLQLVVHDLSEQIRAEEEHSQLSEQLARAQRLDAVGQIAGGLAHDLNNLLVVMVSNLGLANESLDVARDSGAAEDLTAVAEDLGELAVAIDRASGLTHQLLQFARQEEGASGQADVVEVIDAVVALVSRSLGDQVTLRVDHPELLPSIAADPVQLERVLLNLVINARDALEGAGAIDIRAFMIPAAADEAAATGPAELLSDDGPEARPFEHRAGICIQVTDDGCGMDDFTRARAFEPLFTTKSDSGGSGLGLASVLAFVDQSDGQVSLDSSPGAGTTVSLRLPADDAEQARVPVGVDVPVMGARILLVDPGERTRRVIDAMLTGAGYRVTAVSTGEAALDALAEGGADLLVTELALPGVPGTRLIDRVTAELPGVRCVALASVDQPRTLEGTPVLVKPFSHTRLLRTVARALTDR